MPEQQVVAASTGTPKGLQAVFKNILRVLVEKVRKGNSIVLVIAIYAIGALIMKFFIDWSSINKDVISNVNFLEIKDKRWKKRMQYWRGDNYGLETHDFSGKPIPKHLQAKSDEKKKYYLMTGWSCLHVLLYTILGFAAPQYWWLMLIVSGAWELYEFKAPNDYHDLLDIGWNSSGMLLGMALRRALLKR
jgi:hypothetical protein